MADVVEVVALQHAFLRKCFVILCIAGFTCATLLVFTLKWVGQSRLGSRVLCTRSSFYTPESARLITSFILYLTHPVDFLDFFDLLDLLDLPDPLALREWWSFSATMTVGGPHYCSILQSCIWSISTVACSKWLETCTILWISLLKEEVCTLCQRLNVYELWNIGGPVMMTHERQNTAYYHFTHSTCDALKCLTLRVFVRTMGTLLLQMRVKHWHLVVNCMPTSLLKYIPDMNLWCPSYWAHNMGQILVSVLRLLKEKFSAV